MYEFLCIYSWNLSVIVTVKFNAGYCYHDRCSYMLSWMDARLLPRQIVATCFHNLMQDIVAKTYCCACSMIWRRILLLRQTVVNILVIWFRILLPRQTVTTYFHDLMWYTVIKTDCCTNFCNLMQDTVAKTDCCTSVFDFP